MFRRIAYRLFIVFMFLVGGVVEVSQQRPVKHVDISLSEEVMPGSVLPQDSFCEWQYYRPGALVYCRVWRDKVKVEMAYDRNHIVMTTYHPAGAYTLGQLVLSRGLPVSVSRQGYSYYFFWADGSTAYVWTGVLRPTTPILLIMFGEVPVAGTVHTWRGFANNLK